MKLHYNIFCAIQVIAKTRNKAPIRLHDTVSEKLDKQLQVLITFFSVQVSVDATAELTVGNADTTDNIVYLEQKYCI